MSAARAYVGSNIGRYRAIVIAQALELYAKHKVRVNTAYTPTAMLKAAHEITGQPFRRGQYLAAAAALRAWADERA